MEIVPGGLDALALLIEVGEQFVISLVEEGARYLLQASENVSGTRSIFATLQPGAKLPCTQKLSILVAVLECLIILKSLNATTMWVAAESGCMGLQREGGGRGGGSRWEKRDLDKKLGGGGRADGGWLATLMSFLRPFLKQANRILRCPNQVAQKVAHT